jgi:hypothetical protein
VCHKEIIKVPINMLRDRQALTMSDGRRLMVGDHQFGRMKK